MIEINLLPKELQKRRFSFKLDKSIMFVALGCAAIIGVFALYSFVFQVRQYANLEKRLEIARAETARYVSEITKIDEITKKKEQILARMSAIQSLDRNREYWVTMMEDLAQRVPEYVWLTLVKQAPSQALAPAPTQPATTASASRPPVMAAAGESSIEGYSFSLNALATFLIRLKKSDMFDNIGLSSVKLQEIQKTNAYAFKLTCSLVPTLGQRADTETAQAASPQSSQF